MWKKKRRSEALREGYKIVGTRWIDVDKGDEEKPDYRSRTVGKEYNTGPEGGLFASTPMLEALRWLLSEAATVEPATAAKLSRGQLFSQKSVGEEEVILISDVSRAFFGGCRTSSGGI